MTARFASAAWEGPLSGGAGSMQLGSGAYNGSYFFAPGSVDGPGTNPQELIGAAEAACFTMALSKLIGDAGYVPKSITTDATVYTECSEAGLVMTGLELSTVGDVPGMNFDEFRSHAAAAGTNCMVSKALAGTKIEVSAQLA